MRINVDLIITAAFSDGFVKRAGSNPEDGDIENGSLNEVFNVFGTENNASRPRPRR